MIPLKDRATIANRRLRDLNEARTASAKVGQQQNRQDQSGHNREIRPDDDAVHRRDDEGGRH
jgi:hypothetical protein